MKKRLVPCRGITLIELLVSVTIIILLSGLSLAGYYRFNRRQTQINDARNFATVLRRVQAMAKNLVYPNGCDSLIKYTVSSDGFGHETDQTVSALADCINNDYTIIDHEKVLTKAFFTADTDIYFEAGTGKILNGADIVFPIQYVGDTYKIEVKVDQNGIISTIESEE